MHILQTGQEFKLEKVMTLSDSLTQGSKLLGTLRVTVGMMRVFAFLALAAAAPPKDTLAKTTAAILAGEYADKLFTGTHQDCVMKKHLELKIWEFKGPKGSPDVKRKISPDFLVGLGACCVMDEKEKGGKKEVPDCVTGLEEAYKILTDAKTGTGADYLEASDVFITYRKMVAGKAEEL
jgi:hypothetical protein